MPLDALELLWNCFDLRWNCSEAAPQILYRRVMIGAAHITTELGLAHRWMLAGLQQLGDVSSLNAP